MYTLLSFASNLFKCAYIIGIYFIFEEGAVAYIIILTVLSFLSSLLGMLTHDLDLRNSIGEINNKIANIRTSLAAVELVTVRTES